MNFKILFLFSSVLIFSSFLISDSFAITSSGSVANHNAVPSDVTFNSDGTKMFVVEPWSPEYHVHEYTLSTAWDVSTASSTSNYFSLSGASISNSRGIDFNSDGTVMYISTIGSSVYQIPLSTAYDITSAGTPERKILNRDAFAVDFNSDGTKMFTVDNYYNNIWIHPLSTGWDVSTAGTPTAFSIAAKSTSATDVVFNSDGTKMNIVDSNTDKVVQYTLSTAWDLSTASFNESVTLEDSGLGIFGMDFKPDGTRFYVADNGNNKIYQFEVSPAWDISPDVTAPTVSSASAASTTSIVLTMSESVVDSSATASDFSISGAASNPTVSSVSVSGTSVTLNLSASLLGSETITVSYTQTSGNIKDTSGNNLANFSNQSVTNGLTTGPDAQNMKVIPGDGKVTITWTLSDGDLNVSSVTVKTNSTNDGSSFANISSDNVSFIDNSGETRSIEVSGLTNDQVYILKIIAINSGDAGTASGIVVVKPTSNANTDFEYVPPPSTPSSADQTIMESKGIPSDFTMPSSCTSPNSSFDPFSNTLNQKLEYGTAMDDSKSLDSIIDDYAIQQYTKPSDWDVNDVWCVPPSIIPLDGDVGEAAVFSVDSVDALKPFFAAFNDATELDNGGKLAGVKYTLASGKTAANLNMTQKFLSEPPSGVSEFEGAKMYMSFNLETSSGIDFDDTDTFQSAPLVSFTMGPESGSTHSSVPGNTANGSIICPEVRVSLISGSTSSDAGITVTRDTSGDTNSACGYSAQLQHFSDYHASTISSSSSGSGCADCTPPTMGVNKDGKRLVENGFAYNGDAIDVEYYYTPFDLLTVEIGRENIVELKIYENSGADSIQHIGLSFGLDRGQIFGEGLAIIEWDKVYGEEPRVTVTDPENVLDNVRVVADPNLVKCTASSNVEQCMKFRIYHSFREGPDFRIFSTYIWDEDRNGWQNYFNHGLNVVGESLNPPDVHTVFDRQGYLYTITVTGDRTAVDGNGDNWYLDDDEFWKKEFFVKRPPVQGVPMAGYDKNHPYFTAYQDGQVLLAENTLKAILGVDSIQAVLPDYVAGADESEGYSNDSKLDKEMTDKMKLEEIKAFEKMYANYYNSGQHDGRFAFTEPSEKSGFGGGIVIQNDNSQELMTVVGLMIGLVAVSIAVGFYTIRK